MHRLDRQGSVLGDLGVALFKVAKLEEGAGGALAVATGTLRNSTSMVADSKRVGGAPARRACAAAADGCVRSGGAAVCHSLQPGLQPPAAPICNKAAAAAAAAAGGHRAGAAEPAEQEGRVPDCAGAEPAARVHGRYAGEAPGRLGGLPAWAGCLGRLPGQLGTTLQVLLLLAMVG